MANVNVVTAENTAVKAKIQEVTTTVNKGVTELGALFISLCERFTGKDSQSGDNFQHLLNGLEGSKGAKRFQAAIIARLNDFSEKTLAIDFDEDKKTYRVATVKGADNKSTFKKDKFIAAVTAAKAAEFALNPPAKQAATGTKPKRFNPVKVAEKLEASLEEYAVNLIQQKGLTKELALVEIEHLINKLKAKPLTPVIEGEKV
ncbi:hypothetical protein PRA02_004709 [Salmonella enterica]|nr:hypothetical protein [Salmonella enterica]EKL3441006.1 hypothetical protein [Salmonella enterica]